MTYPILDEPTCIIPDAKPPRWIAEHDFWLEVPQEQNDKHVFPLHEGDNAIGQRLDCDIPVFDNFASRRHCVVRVSEHGINVIDLDSTNGTMVNHRCIHSVPIEPGDVIRVGKTQLFFKTAPRRKDAGGTHVHWRTSILAETLRRTSDIAMDQHATANS